jgi:alkylated DNA repair dioxygenase AlkB
MSVIATLDRPAAAQLALFDLPAAVPEHWPPGLIYEPDWLSAEEESALIDEVRRLPFEQARYKSYLARRRVVGYGGRFDYDANRLMPAAPLVEALHPLRDRVAAWVGLPPDALAHALVSEYAPGTPLGWHRDVPDFEDVIGVSLGGRATLRFRPFPPRPERRGDVVRVEVEPRSVYAMRGPSRWRWQHSVSPVDALRWSITFRTRAAEKRDRP